MADVGNAQSRRDDEALITGGLLLLVAAVCNEWLLAFFLASDGVIASGALWVIRGFQSVLAAIGCAFILCRGSFVGRERDGRLPIYKRLLLKGGTALVVCSVLEVSALALVKTKENAVEESLGGYVVRDETRGYQLRPNSEYDHVEKVDGRVLFETTYRFDSFGRRITTPEAFGEANRHLVFFGGSYTFGYGLGEGETLPSFTAGESEGFRVYNYSAPGYGPQQMLASLRSDGFEAEVPEAKGICVYVFIPDHVRRAVGSMRRLNSFTRHFPRYVLTPEGKLEHLGSFAGSRPGLLRFYRLLDDEYLLKLAGVDFPLRIGKGHMELTAKIIGASREAYLERYPEGRFYVVLWPETPQDEFDPSRLVPYLGAEGVEYLDYSDLVDMDKAEYYIDPRYDPHPSALLNEAVAGALAEDLGLTSVD